MDLRNLTDEECQKLFVYTWLRTIAEDGLANAWTLTLLTREQMDRAIESLLSEGLLELPTRADWDIIGSKDGPWYRVVKAKTDEDQLMDHIKYIAKKGLFLENDVYHYAWDRERIRLALTNLVKQGRIKPETSLSELSGLDIMLVVAEEPRVIGVPATRVHPEDNANTASLLVNLRQWLGEYINIVQSLSPVRIAEAEGLGQQIHSQIEKLEEEGVIPSQCLLELEEHGFLDPDHPWLAITNEKS